MPSWEAERQEGPDRALVADRAKRLRGLLQLLAERLDAREAEGATAASSGVAQASAEAAEAGARLEAGVARAPAECGNEKLAMTQQTRLATEGSSESNGWWADYEYDSSATSVGDRSDRSSVTSVGRHLGPDGQNQEGEHRPAARAANMPRCQGGMGRIGGAQQQEVQILRPDGSGRSLGSNVTTVATVVLAGLRGGWWARAQTLQSSVGWSFVSLGGVCAQAPCGWRLCCDWRCGFGDFDFVCPPIARVGF